MNWSSAGNSNMTARGTVSLHPRTEYTLRSAGSEKMYEPEKIGSRSV